MSGATNTADGWWRIALPAGQPRYGYGSRGEADAYCAMLSTRQPGECWYAVPASDEDAVALDSGERDDGIDLADEIDSAVVS